MQHPNNVKPTRRWRRKALATYWDVSERTVDRLRPQLGEPVYIGRMPSWSDEQREAVERSGRVEARRAHQRRMKKPLA
jgi:hypothetical protein